MNEWVTTEYYTQNTVAGQQCTSIRVRQSCHALYLHRKVRYADILEYCVGLLQHILLVCAQRNLRIKTKGEMGKAAATRIREATSKTNMQR